MKHAKLVECRLSREGDRHYLGPDVETTKWIAIDSNGVSFYGRTEEEATRWCAEYNTESRRKLLQGASHGANAGRTN